jgi:hypothetical protein
MTVKNLKTGLLLLLICSAMVAGQNHRWRASGYKGLTPGKSTKADVKRAFGKPVWVGHPEDEYDNPVENMIDYEYENVGGFEGRMAIWMKRRSGVITDILLYPSYAKPLPWQKILNELGNDYIERAFRPLPDGRRVTSLQASSEARVSNLLCVPAERSIRLRKRKQ